MEVDSDTAVAELDTAQIRRKVLTAASAMSSTQINCKINELLDLRRNNPSPELDAEAAVWADIWLRRQP